ncbi:MAG TPA: outer membrane lipoprotein carrier protein LolA [Lentimicrobium sp.]|nr:outer membrane lipoprotein carrier protein LolA [Lentimicrobium sp.]
MKRLILLCWALIFTLSLSAQTDKKAQTILNEVSATTKSYKTVRIEFTYKMENTAQKISDNYKGVLISKGDKYKLTVSGQDVMSDGKTVWTYLKDANEVQVNSIGEDEDSFTPTKLLSSYTENYKAKLIKETPQEQIIELTPIEKKNFNKVRVTVDKAKKMLNSLVIYDKNGSVYSYIINKMDVNQNFYDSMFTFKAADHPGVEVIDMR